MELKPEEFAKALSDEKRRIQEALFSIGYYAAHVKFLPDGDKNLPRLEIEAFPADERSREFFG